MGTLNINRKTIVFTFLAITLVIGACFVSGCVSEEVEPPPPPEVAGCDDSILYERPSDPSLAGPWDVGVQTVSIGRLTADVLYPAVIGSRDDLPVFEVDIRYALPESQRGLVGDDIRPHQRCVECARDLPLDKDHGPYPLVFFVHGTASWRMQSLSLMEHWASRGYVVVAADHPGLFLADMLGMMCGEQTSGDQDLEGDLNALLDAFAQSDPSLDFVSPWVDTERVAVLGHSAGGSAAAGAVSWDSVRVIGSLASNRSVSAGNGLQSSLFMGGLSDSVVSFSQTEEAYEQTVGAKQLMGIADAGHLVFSDICQITNDAGQNLIEIATDAGVCGTEFASFLFDCTEGSLPPEAGRDLVRAATTWVLEKELQCQQPAQAFGDFGASSHWIDVLELSP